MTNADVLEDALKLPAAERLLIVEGLLRSLDVPDPELDRRWAEEAVNRLAAYRSGRLTSTPLEEVFAPSK